MTDPHYTAIRADILEDLGWTEEQAANYSLTQLQQLLAGDPTGFMRTITLELRDSLIGPPGPSTSLAIGTVSSGAVADASITGTAPNQLLSLVLPKGDPGEPGPPGPPGEGSGDLSGPAAAVDSSVVVFDGTTGKLVKDSATPVSDITANTAARHTHANKAVLDATTASYLTAEKTKLAGIADNATQNNTDAYLLDRTHHTGTQKLTGYQESVVTTGTSGTVTLDLSTSNVFRLSPTAAVTIAIGGAVMGVMQPFTLIITNSTYVVTWPAGTKFPGGTAPLLNGQTWISGVCDENGTLTAGAAWTAVA